MISLLRKDAVSQRAFARHLPIRHDQVIGHAQPS